jgi:hypothetical protein
MQKKKILKAAWVVVCALMILSLLALEIAPIFSY